MIIYILTIFILLFTYITKGTVVRDDSRGRVILCFFLLFLVAGLSYNLGADTRGLTKNGYGYVQVFKSIPGLFDITKQDLSEDETFQPGFPLILSFFKTFTSNYLYYQLFHAFLINFVIIYFLRKNTRYIGLCLFFYCMLYYLDLNFEIQRESFAIILGLLIYTYLEKHKGLLAKITTIGIAIFAFYILHRSAFILILYPLLKDVSINKKRIIICFVITLLIQIIWTSISDIGLLLDLVSGDTYRGYIRKEVLDANAGIGPIYYIWLTFWKVVIPYLFVYFSYKNSNPKYLVFVILSIAFENLTYFSFAFHRMYGYFTPFYWLVLTDGVVYLGKKIKIMNTGIIRSAFIICMVAYIVFTYHSDYFREDIYPESNVKYVYNWYVPYQSVLEPDNSYLK